jgi:phosphoribosylformylglycinamidine synthase
VHDVSDGGLLVAIAEMAMASDTGCTLEPPHTLAAHGWWFGEDQGRYVLTAAQDSLPEVLEAAQRADITIRVIGSVGGDDLTLTDVGAISVQELKQLNEAWLPDFMSSPDSNA